MNMPVEIVDLPIENSDFPWFLVYLPEGSKMKGLGICPRINGYENGSELMQI